MPVELHTGDAVVDADGATVRLLLAQRGQVLAFAALDGAFRGEAGGRTPYAFPLGP